MVAAHDVCSIVSAVCSDEEKNGHGGFSLRSGDLKSVHEPAENPKQYLQWSVLIGLYTSHELHFWGKRPQHIQTLQDFQKGSLFFGSLGATLADFCPPTLS